MFIFEQGVQMARIDFAMDDRLRFALYDLLDDVNEALGASRSTDAVGHLNEFANAVAAGSGNGIDELDAQVMAAYARRIIAAVEA